MGTNCGDRVGYHVRFDNTISKNTIITYLTDGMLLREAMIDKFLSKYQYIILDETHERTLNTDILFGLIKLIQIFRSSNKAKHKNIPPLNIIAMSATLQTQKFSKYFNNAPIFSISGINKK